MKYNLMPPDIRENNTSYLVIPEKLFFSAACLCVSVAAVIAGTVFYAWTRQEKEQYALRGYPVQQQIIRQNAWERRLRGAEERGRESDKQRIHWAQVLVCLADTKPEHLMVETLSVRKNIVVITGQVAVVGAERNWLEILRRQEGIKSVSMSMGNMRKTEKERNLPSFKMEVELYYAGDMEPS